MNKILKAVRAHANELLDKMGAYNDARYVHYRDANANLHIVYENGERHRVPIVDFRTYQIEAANELFVKKKLRHLLQRPRRSGKEFESWNFVIQAAIESPGLYMMVYPSNVRGRAVLWDGAILLPDGKSLKFLHMIPKRLIATVNSQEMKIKLHNGSVIWIVGSDIDPDKLRGTNPRGIVFAEFAFQDPRVFYIMLPVLRQNGGWLIGQSTFDGMNHFYRLIENNKDDPLWHCRVDSIVTLVDEYGNRYITDEMVEEDRRAGMPEYLIQQEYYGVVEINQETKYFAHAIKNIYETDRIINNLLIPKSNVYSAFDLGIDDTCGVTLFQVRRIENYWKPIVISYFESSNHNLKYYIDEIRRFCNRYNLPFKAHFVPHDGKKRDFNTGKHTLDFMQEMGEVAYVVPRPLSKKNAIESMRALLYLCEFNKENTQRLIDCLSNYSKEFDDKMGIYKSKPVHDWSSHGVDSFQTMTLALEGEMITDGVSYDVIYVNQ